MYIDRLCSDIPVDLLPIGGTEVYRRSLSSNNPCGRCSSVDDLCTTEVCKSRLPTPSQTELCTAEYCHTKVFVTQGRQEIPASSIQNNCKAPLVFEVCDEIKSSTRYTVPV